MKQQQYLRLFIAQDAEKDNLYNYSHLYLQQHVHHIISNMCTSCKRNVYVKSDEKTKIHILKTKWIQTNKKITNLSYIFNGFLHVYLHTYIYVCMYVQCIYMYVSVSPLLYKYKNCNNFHSIIYFRF